MSYISVFKIGEGYNLRKSVNYSDYTAHIVVERIKNNNNDDI